MKKGSWPFLFVLILSYFFCHELAHAEECTAYIGKTIHPVSIDVVIATVSNLPNAKWEFESSKDYEDRLAKAKSGTPPIFIVASPLDEKQIDYDADNKKFRIKSFAIDNINTTYDGVFGYGTLLYEKVKYSNRDNIDLVVSTVESKNGTYRAKNMFGVDVKVEKVNRTTKAVFEREAVYGEDLFFPPQPYGSASRSNVIVEFSDTSPDVARKTKSSMKAAIVIAPKPPFYAKGKVGWGEPTLEAPIDIDETLEVVVADIKCVLITNQDGKVNVAIPTR